LPRRLALAHIVLVFADVVCGLRARRCRERIWQLLPRNCPSVPGFRRSDKLRRLRRHLRRFDMRIELADNLRVLCQFGREFQLLRHHLRRLQFLRLIRLLFALLRCQHIRALALDHAFRPA
jgi:hypothetical protein